MKICNVCKVSKPLTDYYKNPQTKSGVGTQCKECQSSKLKISRNSKENKDRYKQYAWRSKLKSHYGITDKDYLEMFDNQDGKCAICKSSNGGGRGLNSRLAVDHDHTTGKVRGLLCSKCNQGIGMFNDNPELLEQAINFLIKAKESNAKKE